MFDFVGIGVLIAQMACCPAAASPAEASADTVRVPALLQEDKFRHFAASYAAASFAYGAVRAVDRDAAMPAALVASALIGVAKELHDRRQGAHFDLLDLAANAAGIATAYFFLREIR
jgi:uncharacterized protein YfiM (DUF2279 family)